MPVIFTKPPSGIAPIPYSVSPRLTVRSFGREEQEEPLHPHAGRLGGDEVARLVEDDQHRRSRRMPETSSYRLPASRDQLLGAARAPPHRRRRAPRSASAAGRHLLQRPLDTGGDRRERRSPVEERGDRDLVRRVQHAGCRAPGPPASRASRRHGKASRSGGSNVSSPTAARSSARHGDVGALG